MKNNGKMFEKDIEHSFDDSIYVLRIQDSGSSFSGGSGSRFTPESPYDYIVYNQHNKECLCLELKSTKNTSITIPKKSDLLKYQFYSTKNDKNEIKKYKNILKKQSIKYHQIISLYKAYNKGCNSYFLFNFSKYEKTYAMHIVDFLYFFIKTDKSSININDIIKYNGIEISFTKKRKNSTHCKYDLNIIFNNKRKDVPVWQRLLIAKSLFQT